MYTGVLEYIIHLQGVEKVVYILGDNTPLFQILVSRVDLIVAKIRHATMN